MSDFMLFSLLLLALALGYGMGWLNSQRQQRSGNKGLPQKRYYEGLNHLLNDEPDAAIDAFISALEVNSETLETHLALGSLLRKRGEAARAIRVHQNLLARPSLSKNQLHLAQLELGVDFLVSGLLDRAESLFKELVDIHSLDKGIRGKALEYLLEVYEGTKEWLAAIDIADQLTSRKFAGTPDKWREIQAHYCCELAEEALLKSDIVDARRLIRNALRYDKACVRASLLQASVELKDTAPAVALAVVQRIPRQNPRFATEILELIAACFERLDSPNEKVAMLQDMYKEHHSLSVLNHLAQAIAEKDGEDSVVDFLLHELQSFPQMEAAGELLQVVSNNTSQWVGFNYSTIKGVLEKLTLARAQYECSHCGFRGEQLHWKCPSCRSWSTIAQR